MGTAEKTYLRRRPIPHPDLALLYTSGRRETGIFVGPEAPKVINLGKTFVKHHKD